MAMTLRPDPELTEELRQQAEAEGRPQSAIVLDAVREYMHRKAHKARVGRSAQFGAEYYAEALTTLGAI